MTSEPWWTAVHPRCKGRLLLFMVHPINPLESVTLYNGALNFMKLSFEKGKQDKL